MKRFTGAFVLLFLVSAGLGAQPQPQPQDQTEPLIKVNVDLVSVLFSVRDKKGALMPNLTKDDFTILEDGKQQTIKDFVKESDLPLTIGLLIDVSGSQQNLIGVEREAAGQFFTRVLRQKDMAFLISFGSDAELLQDVTNSARLLREGLSQLRLSTSTMVGPHPGPVPNQKPRGTILFDAVSLASTEKLRGEVGRKAIVIISDGVDVGSSINIQKAIEAAQKADAVIYSIEYTDPRFAGFGGNGTGDLRRMSEETGGRLFRVDRKLSLNQIFDEIQNEMRSQFAIAYTPLNANRDGNFRIVKIQPGNKDLKVQARKGYYATANSGQ